ncbi:hypothetical protein MMC25_004206 [Agyrium rufum]|nr:hypothetical protein [Agyrium rufum]
MDSILQTPLSRIIAEGPNSELTATPNSQPAIMATSIMILRILEQEFGFETADRVDYTLGHSLGEYAALVACGNLKYEDALLMVRARALVMARCTKEASEASGGAAYGMIALVCEPSRLDSLIETIRSFLLADSAAPGEDSSPEDHPPISQAVIANINSKNQIVLSGNLDHIGNLLVQLRQFGGHDPRAVRLGSDSPFHSPIMAQAKSYMLDVLSRTEITYPGLFPCVSNVSSRPFESAEQLKDLLSRQAVETILWWDSIKFLDQEKGVRRWIGLGPGKVGRNLVGKEVGIRGRQDVKGGGVWGLSDPRDVEGVLRDLERTERLDEDEDLG